MKNVYLVAIAIAMIGLQGCGSMPPNAIEPESAARATATIYPPKTEPAEKNLPATEVTSASIPDTASGTREVVPEAIDDPNSIYFALGSAQIDLKGREKLRVHAARLKNDPDLDVTLFGYTDHLGSRSLNLAISEKRTDAVATFLISNGARKMQIRRYGKGNEDADRSCISKACQKKMRRVKLVYSR